MDRWRRFVVAFDEKRNFRETRFKKNNIHTGYLLHHPERITTSKSRIISRNQQMMRLDSEITADLSSTDETALLERVRAYIEQEKPHALILEDYNKGVLTETVIREVIVLCKEAGVTTSTRTALPKRFNRPHAAMA